MAARARIAALLAALGLLLVALTVGAGGPAAAGAVPYVQAASVSISESNPCHGDEVVVTGSGYVPGSTVTIGIGSTVVGRVTVGADGTFRTTLTVPDGLEGPQTLTATGSADGRIATTAITIGSCGLGVAPTGATDAASSMAAAGVQADGAGRGGLSNTGVAVVGLLVVAVALVGAGGMLLLGGRRRRSRAARAA